MSAETIKATPHDGAACTRCHKADTTHHIRSDKVCQSCFVQYVTTKAIKRMETYRIRGSSYNIPRKLLLPVSFGPSSASLLHILDQHIQGQYNRMNRASYELHVVHINVYVDPVDRKDADELLAKYKSRFPKHTYSIVNLGEALHLDGIDWKALDMEQPTEADRNTDRLLKLLASMSSATSRSDIASTLLARLLVDVANRNGCTGILFGDSTTRLAERTLTETAKGRGFSLPWQVSDGASPYGVDFHYPLRDVLKKEITSFSSLATPAIDGLILLREGSSLVSASSKLTTIDDLMVQYFESVEENYPSIVANVVRTSSKLQSLPNQDTQGCGLCGLPVAKDTDGIHGWGGDQNSDSRSAMEDSHHGILCYGCSRSINS
ncbi:cytoplasmic tRNA 2-thiolation protein-like protein 2 [Amylocarpus encephaloides]|uniref:Cytoplasmic tRNA 2-thiolation protein 2 n=1 Tax=Amylocarpus encephaloides TaxID=45428 RepID=A0A9P7YBK0_9HELO|nr:cytoplasmic tRNA 2-thiolation protein-like protein 2 [Amylocarpus encephaloides]